MADTPILAEWAATRVRTRHGRTARRSTMTQWVESNFAELVELRARASWEEIAAVCKKHGLTDTNGEPVSGYRLVNTFSRVGREMRAKEQRR